MFFFVFVPNRYCGKSVPPSLISSNSSLTLVFVADSDLAYEGFLIEYESTNASAGNKTAFVSLDSFTPLLSGTMKILHPQMKAIFRTSCSGFSIFPIKNRGMIK